jgi:preprotein translocase subunit SecE
MSSIVRIWKETVDELVNKVTWPTWEELRSSTVIVIVASILFALAIAAVDGLLGRIIKVIYSLF